MSVLQSKYLELDEGAGARLARRLLSHSAEQGFFSYALLSREEWIAVLGAHRPAQGEGGDSLNAAVAAARGDTAIEALRARYALDDQGAMLVAALRYAPDVEPDSGGALLESGGHRDIPRLPAPIPGKQVARVGRFARGNWYRELLDRLSACAAGTSQDMAAEGLPRIPANRWHRFANSRFPEKALAVAAGLGTIGRNSLLIAERSGAPDREHEKGAQEPRWSSAVVLGLMFLPFDLPRAAFDPRRPPRAALELCASCARCVEACPTGALAGRHAQADGYPAQGRISPSFARARCIQHYTSIEGKLPELVDRAWSDQLYGCDICLEACPHGVPDPEAHVRGGRIGGSFDAAALAGMDRSELRRALKTSTLDQRWISIEALARNASKTASREPR